MSGRIEIDGIDALVSLHDQDGREFAQGERRSIVEQALRILESSEEVIRDREGGKVVCGKIDLGMRVIDVVVKSKKIKRFIFFKNSGAVKNFNKSRLFQSRGIETVFCLAAFNVKSNGVYKSVLVTKRCCGCDLYELFFNRALQMSEERLRDMKSQAAESLCELLWRFEKQGFYHRDAKAQNFMALEEGGRWRILLVDLDGVKRRMFFGFDKRMRLLSKLGGSLIPCKVLNLSDYLRFFRSYCFKKGIAWSKGRREFREVSLSGLSSRLATFVNSVDRFYEKEKDRRS